MEYKKESGFKGLEGSRSEPGTLPQERMSISLGSVETGGVRMDSTFQANDRRTAEGARIAKSASAKKPY
jgi:hypothetical protein